MPQLRLTDLSIQKLPHPSKGDAKYWDTVLPGFGVRVTSRSKAYFISYGKKRQLETLGRHPDMSLKDARAAAKAFQVAPTSKPKPTTLAAAIADYLEDCEKRLRPRTVINYRILLNRLEHEHVEDVVQADATDQHALMCYKIFFNWLIKEEITERNPFARAKVTYGTRTRLLTDAEVQRIWAYEARPFSDHVKLLLLTGQRRNQFSDFEVRGDTLFFPARIMKDKRDHSIPLLPMAKEIIDRHKGSNSWSKNKADLDREVPIPHWVLHDCRRYFSTTMAKLRQPLHCTERLLAHRSGATVGGVAAIYQLHDFLADSRRALARYERHIRSLIAVDD